MATLALFTVGMCAGALLIPAATIFAITCLLTIAGVIEPDPAAGIIVDDRS